MLQVGQFQRFPLELHISDNQRGRNPGWSSDEGIGETWAESKTTMKDLSGAYVCMCIEI